MFTIYDPVPTIQHHMSQRYVHPTDERLEDAFARLQTYNQAKVPVTTVEKDVPVN